MQNRINIKEELDELNPENKPKIFKRRIYLYYIFGIMFIILGFFYNKIANLTSIEIIIELKFFLLFTCLFIGTYLIATNGIYIEKAKSRNENFFIDLFVFPQIFCFTALTILLCYFINDNIFAFTISIVLAIIYEIIELNIMKYKYKVKNYRILNRISDIFFALIGSFIGLYFATL